MLQVLTNRRAVTDEIMDAPDVDETALVHALGVLRRINRISRTAQQMLRPIIQFTKRTGLDRISLLDMACGGGDVPISIALAARQRGINIDLTLLDRSPTAIRQATAAAARAGVPCRGIEVDALGEMPALSADVVTSSLFLHHVHQPQQVADLMRRMREIARHMVIVSDLRRSRSGLLVAWTACRVLTSNKMVHHDGPASVRGAWTLKEISNLAAQAGMAGARIRHCRPWRMLLVWEKQQGSAA
jgi:2-polyprenyl-3-methyl-5-hydroxy-6-metoxy-1,4-benzoquinol methylase